MDRHNGHFIWQSAGQSHVGMKRTLNEDAFLEDADNGLWAIADGMGGHDGGEVASRTIIESLTGTDGSGTLQEFLGDLKARLVFANQRILEQAQDSESGVMGSTVVLFSCFEDKGICLWAGDSRVYLFRGGRLNALTRDHSQVEEMIQRGLLNREEAEQSPARNVITRAVGVDEELQIDINMGELEDGDVYLICSDGLNGVLQHAEIEDILAGGTCESSVGTLIERTLENGAPDNVTAIVIRIHRQLV